MKLWLKGLLSAILGGAAGYVGQTITDTGHAGNFSAIKGAAIAGAIVGVVGYLTKSPLDSTTPKQ